MKLSFLLILLFLLYPDLHLRAQNNTRRPAGFYCPTIQPYDTGNAARALRTYNQATEDTFLTPTVRLGYIYGDTATQQEVMDNLQVGLRVMHFNDYKVTTFNYYIQFKGRDGLQGPDEMGNKVRGLGYSDCPFWTLRKGDIVYFSTYAMKDGHTQTRHMKDTKIVIR